MFAIGTPHGMRIFGVFRRHNSTHLRAVCTHKKNIVLTESKILSPAKLQMGIGTIRTHGDPRAIGRPIQMPLVIGIICKPRKRLVVQIDHIDIRPAIFNTRDSNFFSIGRPGGFKQPVEIKLKSLANLLLFNIEDIQGIFIIRFSGKCNMPAIRRPGKSGPQNKHRLKSRRLLSLDQTPQVFAVNRRHQINVKSPISVGQIRDLVALW